MKIKKKYWWLYILLFITIVIILAFIISNTNILQTGFDAAEEGVSIAIDAGGGGLI